MAALKRFRWCHKEMYLNLSILDDLYLVKKLIQFDGKDLLCTNKPFFSY